MPWLVGVIISALSGAVASILTRVLTGLGIAFVSYQGLKEGFDLAEQQILNALGGAPVEVIAIFKIMGIITAIQIYLAAWGSAIASKLAFRALRFKK